MISQMYPAALDCGIQPGQFWGMSLSEVTDMMDSFRRREEARIRQELRTQHFLARDIGQFTALVLRGSDEMQIMELWDFFPELFGEEKAAAEEERRRQQLAVYKAQMADFAYRHNNRNGGGK